MTRQRILLTLIGLLAALAVILVVVLNLGDARPASVATPTPTPTAGPGQEARSDEPTGQGGNPGDDATGLPLPPAEQREPLVRQPLPKSDSAEGELVAGFPTNLLPIATDATVSSSSVTTEGDRMQAGVEASSPLAVPDVIAYYQAAYAALGLSAREIDAISGSSAYAFAQGDNTITLTVVPTASGSTFTLFGAFRAG